MTADPAHVAPPAHPLPALTTSELARYRRQLETALAARDRGAAAQAGMRDRLAAVLAEQADRARIATRSTDDGR
jgi:hypothetical protein